MICSAQMRWPLATMVGAPFSSGSELTLENGYTALYRGSAGGLIPTPAWLKYGEIGGIHSGADARAKIDAGASLVQVYTGFIFHGPDLVAEARRALEEAAVTLTAAGASSCFLISM